MYVIKNVVVIKSSRCNFSISKKLHLAYIAARPAGRYLQQSFLRERRSMKHSIRIRFAPRHSTTRFFKYAENWLAKSFLIFASSDFTARFFASG